MKYPKYIIFFISFFCIFLLININIVNNVKAEMCHQVNNSQIVSDAFNIVRLSNGTLVSIWIDDSTDDIYYTYSIDNGVTWSADLGLFTGATILFVKAIVLSNDTIIIGMIDSVVPNYVFRIIGYNLGLSYFYYRTGDTYTSGGGTIDLSTDPDDNIHYVYNSNLANSTGLINYMLYKRDLSAWSAAITLNWTAITYSIGQIDL